MAKNKENTIEINGFSFIFIEEDGWLKVSLLEDDIFGHRTGSKNINQAYETLTLLCEQYVNNLYADIDHSVGIYYKMLHKQATRGVIDERIPNRTSVFNTQVGIIKDKFK